jgi:DNA (cytosine-5)-methyltransferase 1
VEGEEMNELALFAGAGGGLLASNLLGWNTVGAVEIERFPREVLLQRQRDGLLDRFPIWDDVRTFDGKPWRGLVDVVSGGFPCQGVSVAGEGRGLADDRSGLWFQYQRIVDEIRPSFVWGENSPALRVRGLGTIVKGLASLGYDIRWGVLGAWHLGAPHERDRMWILATNTDSERLRIGGRPQGLEAGDIWKTKAVAKHDGTKKSFSNAHGSGFKEQRRPVTDGTQYPASQCGRRWPAEPQVGRMVHGFPDRVGELAALGNAQVPTVAATAFRVLKGNWK